jgi:two-component system chemotaxis response regulator CheY
MGAKQHRIMLIEDDETMLSLIQTLLEIEGFEVTRLDRIGSIAGILDEIYQKDPDLLLLDVNMPRVNGFELLGNLRRDDRLKSKRVLVSSGMNVAYEAKQGGADGFILKPFMPEDLIDAIKNKLG